MGIIYKKNNKIYRQVANIKDSEKFIDIFESLALLNNNIVKTKIHSMEKSTLEHELISPIIHSGEYTTSMAYDVTRCALDLALKLLDYKIYSYDLLPHNYTYHNGKWILYDFESFKFQPLKIKTQIRGIFKIVFGSLELLKLLDRKAIKHCFLNRINHFYLFKMIDHKNWFLWYARQNYCLLLHKLHFYKKTYALLNDYFKMYENNFKREYYQPIISSKNQNLYEYIDDVLDKNNITSVFAIGKNSANWSILSQNKSKKFIYFDDYNECDKFYNYIYKNNHNLISTAVIYPFMQDAQIDQNYSYRGLYDYFAKERFNSDAVVILNTSELYTNNKFDIESFCENIVEFSTNIYIHSFDKNTDSSLINNIKKEIEKYYNNVFINEQNNNIIIIAKEKKYKNKDYSHLKQYTNNNRGPEAKAQSIEILKKLNKNTKLI